MTLEHGAVASHGGMPKGPVESTGTAGKVRMASDHTRIGVLLVGAVLFVGCTTTERTAQLERAAESPDGSLMLMFDHPCPEGGPLDIRVDETDTEVVITATLTDGQIIDCMGDWTEVELDSLLGERVVIDG